MISAPLIHEFDGCGHLIPKTRRCNEPLQVIEYRDDRSLCLGPAKGGSPTMEKGIFQFIWRYSKGQQLAIMAMSACSFPFLYMALELPKLIVNELMDGYVVLVRRLR